MSFLCHETDKESYEIFCNATFRMQKGSAQFLSIAFCDEWNLSLTVLKLICFGQWLTVADCLHVEPTAEVIWRLCAQFASLSLSLSIYIYIYIYIHTYIHTRTHTTCLVVYPRGPLDKWVEMFQVVYLLSLTHKSECLLLLFHVSKWKEYTE